MRKVGKMNGVFMNGINTVVKREWREADARIIKT